jgi:hypothetical protein
MLMALFLGRDPLAAFLKEASEHVKKAVGLDKTLQKASVDHPDLDNLWKSIASIE